MDPAFAATRRRLDDLRREWERLRAAAEAVPALWKADASDETKSWIINAVLSAGVSGLYTGMEAVLAGLLSVVDAHVPEGAQSHQDILDQASVAVDDRRPAIISEPVYDELTGLKTFRHFERHNYRFRFDPAQVERNEARTEVLVPMFIRDVEVFIETMSPRSGQSET